MPFSHQPGEYWFHQLAPHVSAREYKNDPQAHIKGVMEVAFCPMTKRQERSEDSFYGTAYKSWRFMGGEGSYSLNLWLLPNDPVYRSTLPGQQKNFFEKYSDASGSVPVLGDSIWVGAWPYANDTVPNDLTGEQGYPGYPHGEGHFMGRFCIDRHKMAISLGFVDTHVERVPLKELWAQKWPVPSSRIPPCPCRELIPLGKPVGILAVEILSLLFCAIPWHLKGPTESMGFNLSKPQVTGAGAGEGTVSPLKWLFRQEGLSFGGMGMASGRILYAWCGNRRATLARCVSVAAGQSYEAALVTYLGASQWERIQSVFVDEDGYIYVGGTTKSSNFPTTPGAYDRKRTGSGVNDGFVAKLSPDGTRLVWSTYLHGSQRDDVYSVWANSQGFVYVTGWTGSSDFPTTVGAYDRTHNGKNDVFLVKLTPDGSKFVYATLLGGSGVDQCRGGMSVDDSGRVYLSGYTDSVDFPVTSGAIQKTFQGGYGDAFVAQLSADGSSLLASTYFGGVAENGYEPSGICVDSASNVHVGGSIFGSVVGHPTTSNAFQQRPTGEGDAFFAMLSPDLSVLMYSSFFGGVGDDRIRDLWLDPRDSIIFAGDTYSANLPTRPDVFQDAYVGNGDSYIARFDPVVIRGAIVNRQ